MDLSLPGSSVHGIIQAKLAQWVVISYCRGSFWPKGWTHISCVSCIGRFFTTSSVQFSSVTQLWPTLCEFWVAAHQASLSLTNFQSLLKHPAISSLAVPSSSSCLQSFPASGSFPMSQFFTSGIQSIGVSASASVLPNEYSGLIYFRIDWLDVLLSKGLSRVLSNATVQKHQFFISSTSSMLLLLLSHSLLYWVSVDLSVNGESQLYQNHDSCRIVIRIKHWNCL